MVANSSGENHAVRTLKVPIRTHAMPTPIKSRAKNAKVKLSERAKRKAPRAVISGRTVIMMRGPIRSIAVPIGT